MVGSGDFTENLIDEHYITGVGESNIRSLNTQITVQTICDTENSSFLCIVSLFRNQQNSTK